MQARPCGRAPNIRARGRHQESQRAARRISGMQCFTSLHTAPILLRWTARLLEPAHQPMIPVLTTVNDNAWQLGGLPDQDTITDGQQFEAHTTPTADSSKPGQDPSLAMIVMAASIFCSATGSLMNSRHGQWLAVTAARALIPRLERNLRKVLDDPGLQRRIQPQGGADAPLLVFCRFQGSTARCRDMVVVQETMPNVKLR